MKKEFKYDTPELILILCDKKTENPLEKIFQKGLDMTGDSYCVLPLYIEQRHVKKMLTAAKLMDVKGLFLPDKYSQLSKALTGSKGGPANAVAFKNKRFKSYDVTQKAYKSYLKEKKEYGKDVKIPHNLLSKMQKNPLFLTHLGAECIKIWSNKNIEIDKFSKAVRRIIVK